MKIIIRWLFVITIILLAQNLFGNSNESVTTPVDINNKQKIPDNYHMSNYSATSLLRYNFMEKDPVLKMRLSMFIGLRNMFNRYW